MPIYVPIWPRNLKLANGDIAAMNEPMQDEWPDMCRAAGYELGEDTAAPFQISKNKLLDAMKALGIKEQFKGYIASDVDLQEKWDNSPVLDSNNTMVLAAIPAIQSLLPDTDIVALLKSCKSDLV